MSFPKWPFQSPSAETWTTCTQSGRGIRKYVHSAGAGILIGEPLNHLRVIPLEKSWHAQAWPARGGCPAKRGRTCCILTRDRDVGIHYWYFARLFWQDSHKTGVKKKKKKKTKRKKTRKNKERDREWEVDASRIWVKLEPSTTKIRQQKQRQDWEGHARPQPRMLTYRYMLQWQKTQEERQLWRWGCCCRCCCYCCYCCCYMCCDIRSSNEGQKLIDVDERRVQNKKKRSVIRLVYAWGRIPHKS